MANILLNYEIVGKGEPLVLLHGNEENIRTLQNQIDDFSQHYKVIAIDSRAHGVSPMGDAPLTYMQMMRDIIYTLNNLHVDNFSIFGFSDGGIIALLLGVYYPERVNKMVVIGANYIPQGFNLISQIGFGVSTFYYGFLKFFSKKFTLRYWRYRLMFCEPNIGLDELQSIKAKTLIVVGEYDMIRRSHTETIVQNIPNSQLVVIEKGDHFLVQNKSEELSKVSINFLFN
ncbi:MAG: alpha/beta hydrolase [Prevotellaceae bacterium]|jgi:pimeloyl-ACP methyl ester carboxylesterase|nr:alpha/beta hydrolase [Prevotellaceae bacterium]